MKFGIFFGIAVFVFLDLARARHDRCFGENNKSSISFLLLFVALLGLIHCTFPEW